MAPGGAQCLIDNLLAWPRSPQITIDSDEPALRSRTLWCKTCAVKQMDRLRALLVGGAVIYVISAAIVFFAWPSGDDSGSVFWTLVGRVGASFGAGMALVAIIAYGVKFGPSCSAAMSSGRGTGGGMPRLVACALAAASRAGKLAPR
jgi:hypothetical protein